MFAHIRIATNLDPARIAGLMVAAGLATDTHTHRYPNGTWVIRARVGGVMGQDEYVATSARGLGATLALLDNTPGVVGIELHAKPTPAPEPELDFVTTTAVAFID